jgi:Neutral/alkaline non-lysosomal ceramidase, N-terminal
MKRLLSLWIKHVLFCLSVMGLASSTSQAEAASGSLRAGAARVELAPAAASARYDHEHVYIRVIVLDNGATRGALIGADMGNMPEDVWQDASKKIAMELNCPVENIIMSATHTHSGFGRGESGAQPASTVTPTASVMLDAVRQAKARLQPARMGYGTGMAYLNVNRDAINPETHLWTQAPDLLAASDKTVAVLKFETLTGQPIAAYVNYAMHPVNGYLSGFLSADYAGAMSRYVEQAYDDKMVAVFTQGASGDQNPLYLRASTNLMASKSGVPITGNVLVRETVEARIREGGVKPMAGDPKVIELLKRWMESTGMVLGEEVIRVMTDTTRVSGEVRIAGAQKVASCPGRMRTDKGREGLPGTYKDADPVQIRLGMLGIGDVAITSVNAEVYNLISQRMKKQSPMANTMMVTLANGRAESGYIPDDASFSHNTFQVLGTRLKPGCAESAIANDLADLVSQYDRQ